MNAPTRRLIKLDPFVVEHVPVAAFNSLVDVVNAMNDVQDRLVEAVATLLRDTDER